MYIISSAEAAARKKSKKKKRKQKDIERSSGDSDSQVLTDEKEHRLPRVEGKSDQSQSGIEADSEGTESKNQVPLDQDDKAVSKDGQPEDSKVSS